MVSNFDVLVDGKFFVVSNGINLSLPKVDKSVDSYYIFGHCFSDNDILKDRALSKNEYDYIKINHEKISGLFVCIGVESGVVNVIIDPLVQYPVFFIEKNGCFTVSNKLSLISAEYSLNYNINYLYDSLIYEAPMRGGTPLKEVRMFQFDDLQDGSILGKYDGLVLYKTSLVLKSGLDYQTVLTRLVGNIRSRAKIIADRYKYIECQLSGGLDCRIVAAAFKEYRNVYYYSFGSDSQDRLCFEDLADRFSLNKITKIKFFGAGVRNAAMRLKMVDDLNGIKLHTYGGYMNYDYPVDSGGCKLSGYFGEYLGHKLPSAYISPENGHVVMTDHIKALPDSAYKVAEDYSVPFYLKNSRSDIYGKSTRAITQLFYMNNRGPSHFGMHSVADNLHDCSYNVLYDPLALTLSELSPYSDAQNKDGATCIDLIAELGGLDFALFPYEGRKIPLYKDFGDIQKPNCFTGYRFEKRPVEQISRIHNLVPDVSKYDLFGDSKVTASCYEILNREVFDIFFTTHSELAYLRREQDLWPYKQHQEILCNFLLSVYLFNSGIGLGH